MEGKEPSPFENMTYTEQALRIAQRQVEVAKRDGSEAHARGVTFKPSGYIYIGSDRFSFEAAVQHIAAKLEQEQTKKEAQAKLPKVFRAPTMDFSWEKLNQATQDFFFDLGEQIQTVTQDHSMLEGVRLGHDIPKISLKNAPRLSNLKKGGLVKTYTDNGCPKSHKFLALTEQGQAVWAAHKG